jgi:hypothetical protein
MSASISTTTDAISYSIRSSGIGRGSKESIEIFIPSKQLAIGSDGMAHRADEPSSSKAASDLLRNNPNVDLNLIRLTNEKSYQKIQVSTEFADTLSTLLDKKEEAEETLKKINESIKEIANKLFTV